MTRRRRQRAAALVIGGLCALGMTLAMGFQVATWTVGPVEHTSHQLIPGPVRELRVDAGAGEIVVVPGAGPDVSIDSTVKGSFRTPELRPVKEGDVIRLGGDCSEVFGLGPCRASMVIHVPPATDVRIKAGSGSLTASGLSGDVWLETGSGDVHASELRGDAELETASGDLAVRALHGVARIKTASGDIEAEQLTTRSIEAKTSSGDVELAFLSSPREVNASTASGDVDVLVPAGQTYYVRTDTGSGDQRIDVRTDPDALRAIVARTSSGDVSIAYSD